MDVTFENPPDEVRRDISERQIKERFEDKTIVTDFKNFCDDYSELKDKENQLKNSFIKKISNGVKYILYKDPRKIAGYETDVGSLALLSIFLVVLLITTLNLMVYFVFF